MDMLEIKGLVEAQGKAWEEFKANNDARIKAEAKAQANALFEEKSARINDSLSKIESEMKALAARSGRIKSDEEARSDDYSKAFSRYMRKGDATELESKALDTINNSGADGGYAVPKIIDTEIVKKLVDISPVRSVAQVVQIGTGNYVKLADVNGTASGWVAETAARTATATPQLAQITPTMGELYANPQATQVMLDDAQFDAEAWLAASVAEEFARAEGAAFISGDGTNKPTGFLTGAPVATADASRAWGVLQYVASGQASALPAANTYGDIYIDIVHSLKAGFRANAMWMAAKAMVGSLRKIKDGDNNYLWRPGMEAGVASTFLGYPVVEAENMPAVAANAFPLAFGDFRAGYLIVDRTGVRVIRDQYTNKPYVGFYTVKRVGGIVQNSEAIKLLKIAAS